MSTKKEGLMMAKYMNKVKVTIDNLALINHLLSDAEITVCTLTGHADESKKLIATVLIVICLLPLRISMINFQIIS